MSEVGEEGVNPKSPCRIWHVTTILYRYSEQYNSQLMLNTLTMIWQEQKKERRPEDLPKCQAG